MAQGLSVGDGFKFGCGFILAYVVFCIVMAIVGAIVFLLLGVLGMSATQFLQRSDLILLTAGLFV